MICLTGDVHQESLNTGDQQSFSESVEEVTRQYRDIATSYGLKTTLFVTGKFCVEASNPRSIKNEFVEIGGHTWSAFRPQLLHSVFSKILGFTYGPKIYQKFDIYRTLREIKSTFGTSPKSWRTHAYLSNDNTFEVLDGTSVEVVSDEVTPNKYGPSRKRSELQSLPINVMPDHEHIYHGNRTEEHVRKLVEDGWSDAFTHESYQIDEYMRIIRGQIRSLEEKNGIATLLLHPACMKAADSFGAFEELCEWIYKNDYETIWAKEAVTRG